MRKNPIREDKGSFRFRREERLKGRDAIREVFSKGRRIGCQGAKLFMLKNDLPCNRICFTFSRNYGTAVERNRAKRLGREAYRSLKPRLSEKARLEGGYDLIFLAYPDDLHHADRAGQLRHLLSRGGLLP